MDSSSNNQEPEMENVCKSNKLTLTMDSSSDKQELQLKSTEPYQYKY